MRQTTSWSILAILSLAISSGCRLVDSLRASREIGRPDLPGYSIEEQERVGRQLYGIPDDDPRVGPKTGIGRPGPIGVGY